MPKVYELFRLDISRKLWRVLRFNVNQKEKDMEKKGPSKSKLKLYGLVTVLVSLTLLIIHLLK
jgi:hypothetical protein